MPPNVTLYGLMSCAHCKEVREHLMDRNIPFECIYVDLLTGEERSETLRELRRLNPEATFPTLVVGDKVIVGYKKEEIRQTLDESESQSQEAVRECRVLTQPKSGGG